MDRCSRRLWSVKRASASVALVLVALVCVVSAGAADSLRVTATDLGGNILLVGRYHISNPNYCLATKPSYSAPNYERWLDPRCVAYTVQRADFSVSVLHNGRSVYSDSFRIDGAYGDPSQDGTITPYYIYCGLLADAKSKIPPKGSYYWAVTLNDPFRRSGYNISRRGSFRCR
jgi:hypothetical protein